jgi:predicted lipoprotein with Yx(FWY)xxD motif/plastocyanin
MALALVAAACSGSDKPEPRSLGALTVFDYGTKDVSNQTSARLEVKDFHFSPTFLRGEPAQRVELTLVNKSETLHNLTIDALQLSRDLPSRSETRVEVTFPDSGVLLFVCRYHLAESMGGELLAGNAQPQPPARNDAQASLRIADVAPLGRILTDPTGRTLYVYKLDRPGSGQSAAPPEAANQWPPLLVSDDPIAPAGLSGKIGVIERGDGGRQLTYNGRPLYYYAGDAGLADTKGNGLDGAWFVAAP